jgi:hypothetical protein
MNRLSTLTLHVDNSAESPSKGTTKKSKSGTTQTAHIVQVIAAADGTLVYCEGYDLIQEYVHQSGQAILISLLQIINSDASVFFMWNSSRCPCATVALDIVLQSGIVLSVRRDFSPPP